MQEMMGLLRSMGERMNRFEEEFSSYKSVSMHFLETWKDEFDESVSRNILKFFP